MSDLEKLILFMLIDKYTNHVTDEGYEAMDLERLVLEYAKSRGIYLDYVDIY